MGIFEKLKRGLAKTHDNIFAKVDKLVYGKSKVDDEIIDQIEEILLSSDIGVQTTEIFIENLKKRVKEEKFERTNELYQILKDELKKVFTETITSTNGFKIEKILPMRFDAFYVSLLSEKYKSGKMRWLPALWNGFWSNIKAGHKNGYSSLIYVLKCG